jgi:2-phospho-L-lactate guanylyltransferase
MILVPIKDFASAKQRLAPVLTPEQRRQLAHVMFADVLRALAAIPSCPTVAVVTRDAEAMRMASQFGFSRIYDGLNAGETEAIAAATEQAIARGAQFTLVIPGDAPLVTPEEIMRVLDTAPKNQGTVLAAAADNQGTNAILRRPADLFPARFGNQSFLPHLRAAIATRKPTVVLRLAGLALDVDRPDDLHALACASGAKESQRLVRSWGFGSRAAAIARAAGF